MLFSASAMSCCFAIETGLLSAPQNHAASKAAVFILFFVRASIFKQLLVLSNC